MGLYDLAKRALFTLPPETAHHLAITGLSAIQDTPIETAMANWGHHQTDRLSVTAFGTEFPNPLGLAAGFDKNANAPCALAALGFGHIEVGGVTARPQPGNPRPRLFRLPEDQALINRFGFNNDGADVIARRLAAQSCSAVPIGVNIGKSKTTPLADAPDDYAYTYRQVADVGDFFVVNVSSPNTPGLRTLQDETQLRAILGRLKDEGAAPLLVKLSPDLTDSATIDALAVVDELDLDGVIAVNTTTRRPDQLTHHNRVESGGLSGAPLREPATERIRFVANRVDVPVIGVGGIASAADAYRKIKAGASVVQLYTAFVYKGPTLPRNITAGLLELLDQDGFDTIEAAIGADL